jgi:hypothetical protein
MEAGQISALYMEVTTIGNPEPTRDEACGHESGVASAERHGEHAGREERVGQHQLACRSPGGPPAGIDMSMNTLIDPGGPQVSSAHNQPSKVILTSVGSTTIRRLNLTDESYLFSINFLKNR